MKTRDAPIDRPKRRFQFGIRTMFVVMTLATLPLAFIIPDWIQISRERSASLWLESINAEVFQWHPSNSSDQSWLRSLYGMKLRPKAILLQERGLQDISPITGFHNLEILRVEDAQIQDLSPLQELKDLRFLDLYVHYDFLVDMDPGMSYNEREKFPPQNNTFTDLTPLGNLEKLEGLYLFGTGVSDLSPLSDLSNLAELDLRYTQVTDLSPLGNLENLKTLKLTGTNVSDLTALTTLPKLEELYLEKTNVSDLTPLTDSSVRFLHLNDTPVQDLRPLLDMRAFAVTLFLDPTQSSQLSPLTEKDFDDLWSVAIEKIKKRNPTASLEERREARPSVTFHWSGMGTVETER